VATRLLLLVELLLRPDELLLNRLLVLDEMSEIEGAVEDDNDVDCDVLLAGAAD
jgi:hypothetical protein